MLPNKMRLMLLGVVAVLLCTLVAASAQAGGAEIKARMRARLPQIDAMKAQGVVGETNDGLLAFVGSAHPNAAVVDAENADRRLVYAAIARQQKVPPAVVGQRRALQIAERAEPGTWLQDAGGKWYRK